MRMSLSLILRGVLLLALLGGLSACERLGLADPVKEAAMKEADAKATGSACRHAGRAIEDCYALNPDFARAAVYAGWKEMNDYMRENNIQEVKPEVAQKSGSETEADSGEKGDGGKGAEGAGKDTGKKAEH